MDFIDSDSDDENTSNLKDLSNSELLKLRPKACGVLSFHNGIEEMMFLYVIKNSEKNNPISIIKSIDKYCYSKHWMMHIGNQKSKYLVDALNNISNKNNELIVEIGCYCGYSALIIAMNLSSKGHLICIDISPKCIEWTRKLLEYAGLLNKVSLILNKSIDNEIIEKIQVISNALLDNNISIICKNFNKIDMLFIDHEKGRYLQDLKYFENSNMLSSGCLVVADNVMSLSLPLNDYLSHVQNKELYVSSETYLSYVEYSYGEIDKLNDNLNIDEMINSDGIYINSVENLKKEDLIDGIEISVYK